MLVQARTLGHPIPELAYDVHREGENEDGTCGDPSLCASRRTCSDTSFIDQTHRHEEGKQKERSRSETKKGKMGKE